MVFENERATLVIERDGFEVAVVMIASRLVRRIVTYLSEGDRVAAGQRIGMIRFGSQVDLVLPVREDLRVDVRSGDRVVAGESIVARVESLSARAAAAGRDPTASVRAPS
jgi:phosphatidylserine decarboxylase